MRKSVVFALAVACVVPGPQGQAQTAAADREFRKEVHSQALRGRPLSDIRDRMLQRFRAFNVDDAPGVSNNDLVVYRQQLEARFRASILNTWLVYDLDGNFEITEDELRPDALRQARRPLRSGGTQIEPTPEQVEQIARDLIDARMERDLDGDRVVTLDELSAFAAETAERRLENDRTRFAFPAGLDTDGDGRVTEAEYAAGIDAAHAALDVDGDGAVTRQEAATATANATETVRQYLDRAGLSQNPAASARSFAGARAGCELPDLPDGTQAYFIGAYDGTALTDIHLGDPTQPAELLDITIPEGAAPIALITTFYGDTILRLRGAADRVADVISTGPRIGIVGGGTLTFASTPAACHIQVWGGVTPEHPDPRAFFADRLGAPLAGAVTAETLATADLGLGTARATGRLPGASPTVTSGDTAEAWRRFAIFNPGGFIPLDPATVQTSGQATRLTPRPQMAGIAQLVSDGVLVRIPQKNSAATVLEDDAGAIKIGGKTFVPGFGDDAITMNSLTYIEERPKTWVGRALEVYLVTRPFTYPAGLTGAHSVVFLLPEGMAEPTGAKGHTRIQRITR